MVFLIRQPQPLIIDFLTKRLLLVTISYYHNQSIIS